MTDDAEAPDRLYELTAKETIDRLRKVIEGQGLSMQTMTRELGEANAKLGIAINDARAESARLQKLVAGEPHGHNAPCLICQRPCSSLAGNPSLWPVRLGNTGWHHVGCINNDLIELERLRGPVGADVMERARHALDTAQNFEIRGGYPEILKAIARALQAYGDERAREGVSYEAAGNAVSQVLEAERARCEQIVDAVRDEQRRIADARVAQVRRELGGFARADKHSWMTGWG